MRRIAGHLFLSILFTSICASAGGADQLWQKSLEHFSRNTQLHPKKMLVTTQEFSESGELEGTAYAEIEYSLDNQGELKSEIVQAVKDGKDVSAQQRRRRRRNDNPFMISPFNPDLQNSVEVVRTDETARLGASLCRKYNLSLEYEKNRYSGVAWLEAATGAPLLLEITLESLPRNLDYMVMTFHDTMDWYTNKIVMEGAGTILFKKKRFHSETILDGLLFNVSEEQTR